jgi:hypothetical protein
MNTKVTIKFPEDESYDEMKARTRFAQKLLKYRAYLYDYSVYENN